MLFDGYRFHRNEFEMLIPSGVEEVAAVALDFAELEVNGLAADEALWRIEFAAYTAIADKAMSVHAC
jgi:hypothetical protein